MQVDGATFRMIADFKVLSPAELPAIELNPVCGIGNAALELGVDIATLAPNLVTLANLEVS